MKITQELKTFLIISSLMMALSICIGAFGAHGLKAHLDEYSMKVFQTGVSYQFYNTLGLFAISFLVYVLPKSKKVIISFYLLLIGIFLFSFSLYALAILQITWFGMITPIGGSFMIISWLLNAYCLKDLKIDNN